MSQTRDPRTEPKAGDMLKRGKFRRLVIALGGTCRRVVFYASINALSGRRNASCWITTWRDWAAKAEVIHAADCPRTDPQPGDRLATPTGLIYRVTGREEKHVRWCFGEDASAVEHRSTLARWRKLWNA